MYKGGKAVYDFGDLRALQPFFTVFLIHGELLIS